MNESVELTARTKKVITIESAGFLKVSHLEVTESEIIKALSPSPGFFAIYLCQSAY
jgi:hypothetical protein